MQQQIINKTVSQYLDEDYALYGMYTLENRAIPSVIDGFKPTQRKIIYVADRVWRSGNEKPLKIFQLGGKIASEAHYHHGDGSLNVAIVGMAQSFKNSLPLLEEIGQFGSLRSPEAGAPRYISTKTTKNFRLLYKDFELLENQIDEGDEIEPKYFLPIIPTVLLNGSSGIAVGFATNILNRNPIDLIDACLRVLDGKPVGKLLPWWRDYSGRVEQVDSTNQYIMHGSYRVLNTTTVEVTELPPSITFAKYEAHLNSLLERGIIYNYEDNSSSGINYVIKFSRATLAKLMSKGRLESTLKMLETETENLTCLNEHGKLIEFSTVPEVVEYFTKFRLSFYDKRKAYLIDKYNRELKVLSNRARFVKSIIEKKLTINNVPKAQIVLYLETANFDEIDGSYSYLLNMPIHSLTKETYEQLLKEVEDKKVEIAEISKRQPIDMYREDLLKLKQTLRSEENSTDHTRKRKVK
jgi:DNA topoisomerase-2